MISPLIDRGLRFLLLAIGLLAAAGAQAASTSVVARYLVLGEDGARFARAVTEAAACPVVDARAADGRPDTLAMTLRAAPAVLPPRGIGESGTPGKPAVFPVRICEATLPPGILRARIEGVDLPLPPARVERIVVIGDTGCRIKQAERAVQDCNDPAAYPFAEIARRAAAWKPDLVVHVGDYLYRESPCPEGRAGCAGSPWGQGWDAWSADLFTPAAPLLQAAPWVVVRGNHEDCARAGLGWFRLLDPRPLTPGRDCLDPGRDEQADYSAPYAVPLGGGAQVIVLDLTAAGEKAPAPDSLRARQATETWDAMTALSQTARYSFVANHKPILGFGAQKTDGGSRLRPGNLGPQSVFAARNPNLFPDTVQVLLSGHIHIWEQLSFATPQPTQFVTGFSGTLEDVPNIPEHPPADATPAAGAVLDQFSVWNGQFGWMTLERRGADRWAATVHDVQGGVVRRCEITGRRSVCRAPD